MFRTGTPRWGISRKASSSSLTSCTPLGAKVSAPSPFLMPSGVVGTRMKWCGNGPLVVSMKESRDHWPHSRTNEGTEWYCGAGLMY